MKMTTKAMDAPVGLRVSFDTAPVVKFHIAAKRPNPTDPYRVDVTITLPQGREDLWLEGVNAAFHRIQHGNGWAVRLDYPNAIRYFNIDQLKKLDKKNPGFTVHVYRVPESAMSVEKESGNSVASTRAFARLYYKQRKEAERNGSVCERDIGSEPQPDAV